MTILSSEGEANKSRGIVYFTEGDMYVAMRYYFFDETWEKENAHGPYYTLYEARKARRQYVDFLYEGGDESEPTS